MSKKRNTQTLPEADVTVEYKDEHGNSYTLTGRSELTLWIEYDEEPPVGGYRYITQRATAGIEGEFLNRSDGSLYTIKKEEKMDEPKVKVSKEATINLPDDYTLDDLNLARERAGAPSNTRFRIWDSGSYARPGYRVKFLWSDYV